MKYLKLFDVVCKTCLTVYHLDQKLPAGAYQFHEQRYGKDSIMRFMSIDCPFCQFDEDILKGYDESK